MTRFDCSTGKIPYWLPQLVLFAVGVLLIGLLYGLGWVDYSVIRLLGWGLFWGFAYCFSLVCLGKLILNPWLFAFPLIRIFCFGYCMVVTAGFNRHDSLLEVAGFLGYSGCLLLVHMLAWLNPPENSQQDPQREKQFHHESID